MPLDFPNSPTNGQTYNAGGKTWEYNGGVWVLRGVVANLSVDGVTGLGTNVATFLATPTSANLAAAVTGETGSGSAVFSNSPSLVSPSASATVLTGTLTAGGSTGTSGQALISTGAGVQWTLLAESDQSIIATALFA